jgi:hypothetical protein
MNPGQACHRARRTNNMGISSYQMLANHIWRFKPSHMICRALLHGGIPTARVGVLWKLIC